MPIEFQVSLNNNQSGFVIRLSKIAPSKCEDRWISLICGISRSLFAWDKKEILNYNLEENYPSYGIHIKNLGYLKCDHYLKSSSSHLKHTKSMMWIPFCLWYGEPVNWWYLKVLCQAKVLPATSTTWDILNVKLFYFQFTLTTSKVVDVNWQNICLTKKTFKYHQLPCYPISKEEIPSRK